jgi:hypothetical protein
MVVAVPFAAKLIVEGLKLHVDSAGRPEQFADAKLTEPLKLFSDVNVSVVDPDCPGALIVIVVGLAASVNATFTVITSGEAEEPALLLSPL